MENRNDFRNFNADITKSTCFVHNVPKTKHSGIQAKKIKVVERPAETQTSIDPASHLVRAQMSLDPLRGKNLVHSFHKMIKQPCVQIIPNNPKITSQLPGCNSRNKI
jgi:hypothetical protein